MSELEKSEMVEGQGTGEIQGSAVTETEQDVDEIPPVVRMSVSRNDIRRYYTEKNVLDIKDLIVHVRSKYPNPRQRVLLTCDMNLPTKELADIFIFVDGDTEHNVDEIRGLGRVCYCPIEVTKELMQQEGYGIQTRADEFCSMYNISNCELLVYGDDTDDLIAVWEHLSEFEHSRFVALFPHNVVTVLKLFSNGIDIAPYAKRMSQAMDRNSLTIPFISGILKELSAEITQNGKVALQNFEETRSVYAKWLTLSLTYLHKLSPVYLGSYLAEYVSFHAGYPLDKLSMFERLHFLSSVPNTVGFIGEHRNFTCVMSVHKKIYPKPYIAYDLEAQEVIRDNMEEFEVDRVRVVDWRRWFRGSPGYFKGQKATKPSNVPVPISGSDAAVDKYLAEIFMSMAAHCVEEQVSISVRNTLLVIKDGKYFVVHYIEESGLLVTMMSEYFGAEPQVIPESRFHQLVDSRIILAREKTRNISVVSEKNRQFTELVQTMQETFTPAIPVHILMYSTLVGHGARELSYYDQRLRCDKNVMPIVTHRDSTLSRDSKLFDHINILNVGRDPVASPVISSFGSINAEMGYFDQLPVSIETFRGCQLL